MEEPTMSVKVKAYESSAGATPVALKAEPKHNTGGVEVMATQAPAAPAATKQHETIPEPKSIPASEVLSKIPSVSADRYQTRRDIQLGGQGACKVAFDQLAEREIILKTSSTQGGWSGERIIKEARF